MDKYTRILSLSIACFVFVLISFLSFFYIQQDSSKEILGVREGQSEEVVPSLGTYTSGSIHFNYDYTALEVKQHEEKVVILPKSWQMFQYATVLQEEDPDVVSILNIEEYPGLQEESFEEKEGYEVYLFSFSQPSFLNPEEEKIVYLTVYVNRDGLQNNFILVRNFNYLLDSQTDQLFAEIARSVKYLSQREATSFIEEFSQEVLGSMGSTVDPARVLGQSASVRLFSRNCYDVSFSEELFLFQFAGNSYNICGATMGTGFAITPYGDILTNAHVIRPHRFDSIANGISGDGKYEEMMGNEVLEFLQFTMGDFVIFLTQEQIQTFYVYMLNEMYNENYLSISGGTNKTYVQATENFDVDLQTQDLTNKSNHHEAIIIKSNEIDSIYQTMFSLLESETLMEEGIDEIPEEVQEGISSVADIALIRISNNQKIPSLSFSPNRPVQGQDIRVVGFPGIVDEKSLVSSSALTGSTVTSGSITGIQPNTNNTYDLLQIDASVESGNSGGPIINTNGEVLGMTTYASFSGSGNFNWGVSSTELKNFLGQEGIPDGPNEQSRVLSSALNDISKDYYARSQGKLEDLVQEEPLLAVTLNPLIDMAKENVELGNDKSPWIDLVYVDIPNWGLLLIGGVLLVLFLLLLILIISKIKKRKNKSVPAMFDVPEVKEPEASEVVTQEQEPAQDERGYLRPQTPPVQEQVETPVQQANPVVNETQSVVNTPPVLETNQQAQSPQPPPQQPQTASPQTPAQPSPDIPQQGVT